MVRLGSKGLNQLSHLAGPKWCLTYFVLSLSLSVVIVKINIVVATLSEIKVAELEWWFSTLLML